MILMSSHKQQMGGALVETELMTMNISTALIIGG